MVKFAVSTTEIAVINLNFFPQMNDISDSSRNTTKKYWKITKEILIFFKRQKNHLEQHHLETELRILN